MNEQTDQWSIDEQIFYHHTNAYGVTKDLGLMCQKITDELLTEHPARGFKPLRDTSVASKQDRLGNIQEE